MRGGGIFVLHAVRDGLGLVQQGRGLAGCVDLDGTASGVGAGDQGLFHGSVQSGGLNKDWEDIRGDGLTASNDTRYSNVSLAYYLAGALDLPVRRDDQQKNVPLDGVLGMGMVAPLPDGAFKVPGALRLL